MSNKPTTLIAALDKSTIPEEPRSTIKEAVVGFYTNTVLERKRVTLRAKAVSDRATHLKKLAAAETAVAEHRAAILKSYETSLKEEADDDAVRAKFPAKVVEAKVGEAKVVETKEPKEPKVAKEPKEPKVKVAKEPKAKTDGGEAGEAAPAKGVKRPRKPKADAAESADPHTSQFAETEVAKPKKVRATKKAKAAAPSSSDDSSDGEAAKSGA